MDEKENNHNSDFMDINWVIDHVGNLKNRIEILEELGYKIAYNVYINKEKSFIKSIIVGKKGELRIQVSEKLKGLPLVYCVIL
jgi:hypothetical protein